MSTTPDLQRIIDDPRYTVRELSDAIEEIPNEYGLLGDMGLFPEQGIPATFVEIERKKGELNILPVTERDGPATKGRSSRRDKIIIPMMYLSHEDALKANELQNLPMFGTESFYERFDVMLGDKLDGMTRKFRQTFEYHRWGALRGKVFDADGVSELYDVYDIMGEEQRSIDYKFGTVASDGTLQASKDARRYMEKALLGETMRGALSLCSPGFMDKLTTHPAMREMYLQQQRSGVSPHPLFDDVHNGFKHGDQIYIEHSGEVSYLDPETGEVTVHQFIPDEESIIIPIGTQQTFRSYFGPGTTIDSVNAPGRAIFPRMKRLDYDKGIEIWCESAPLFLVQKPRLVMRGYSSN